MKTLIRLMPLSLIILAVIGFSSCEKKIAGDGSMGKLEISLYVPGMSGLLKSATLDSIPPVKDTSRIASYQLLISIEDLTGKLIISDKLIPVYSFGTGFVSENLEIPAGEYKLSKFMVINSAGQVIYAAPIAGSPLAYLVNIPLPLKFVIAPGQVTRILPEVLAAADQSPSQFGYANFAIQMVYPLSFYVICVLDNPMLMAPTQITQAKLTVYANSIIAKNTSSVTKPWSFTFKLEAAVNHITIRGGSESYVFVLEKEGYLPQKMQFSSRELKATSKENPLVLKIPMNTVAYKTLIIQPGPDGGKDAMISNIEPDKNFGAHKYFETTYLSDSLLTVMRSKRSLIWFNTSHLPDSAIIRKVILTLSYNIPVPWNTDVFSTSPIRSDIQWYGAVLQQIIEPWEEDKVSWNTQPKSIEANQVYVSPFIKNANFLEIDVTRLFVPVQEIQAPNYGMMFKLYPTELFPGFRFASSDYPDAVMRPKLIIQYTVPV